MYSTYIKWKIFDKISRKIPRFIIVRDACEMNFSKEIN